MAKEGWKKGFEGGVIFFLWTHTGVHQQEIADREKKTLKEQHETPAFEPRNWGKKWFGREQFKWGATWSSLSQSLWEPSLLWWMKELKINSQHLKGCLNFTVQVVLFAKVYLLLLEGNRNPIRITLVSCSHNIRFCLDFIVYQHQLISMCCKVLVIIGFTLSS